MNSTDFTYWLQGFVELQDSDMLSEKQWLIIKDHLKLVFDKKTPDRVEFNPLRVPSTQDIVDQINKKVDPSYFGIYPAITC